MLGFLPALVGLSLLHFLLGIFNAFQGIRDISRSSVNVLLGIVIDLILKLCFLFSFLGTFCLLLCLGFSGSFLLQAIALFCLATTSFVFLLLLKHVQGACLLLLAGAIFLSHGQQGKNRIPASVLLQDRRINVFDIRNHEVGDTHLHIVTLLLLERILQIAEVRTATGHNNARGQLVFISRKGNLALHVGHDFFHTCRHDFIE